MTKDKFKLTLDNASPPKNISLALEALWWHRQNDWEHAHSIVQGCPSRESAWVHALLHREEGDYSNAAYWYRRANQTQYHGEIQEEWEAIVTALCL